ncbi:uncharacterized protein LOC121418076 [Lytechinus variegatus]|uniref:uncharacterized protein LOC121418076 n=1 Tax=Lytechinus variegatus TaxID=7654 RepID=UPI001BB19336|nr:uncharacterized protein LOC121418076 [Lytechinus variegatus]
MRTSANNVHFQAYLLEGVHRWNCDRARDAEAATAPSHASYGSYYEFDVNRLTEKLFGIKINPTLTAPQKYTGELIGLEYLFNQTNEELLPMHPDEGEVEDDDGEDVGRREGEDVQDPTEPPPEFGVRPASSRRASRVSSQQPVPQHVSTTPQKHRSQRSSLLPVPSTRCRPHTSKAPATVSRAPDSPPPTSIHRTSTAPATVSRAPDSPRDDTPDGGTLAGDEEVKDVEDVDLREDSDEEHTGRIPGYDRVTALGNYLLKLRGDDHLMSSRDAKQIVKLWNELDPYDKQVRRPARHQEKLTKGRFKAKGTSPVVPGIESTQRCFLGSNSGPASVPNANRVMEYVIGQLCSYHPDHRRHQGRVIPRWTTIIHDYKNIRSRVLASTYITSNTRLQLLDINRHVLIQWHNRRSKEEERSALEMGASAPRPSMTAHRSVPPPKEKPHALPPPPIQRPFQFPTISNTVGQAKMRAPIAQPAFVLLPVPVMAVPSTPVSTPAPTTVTVPGFRSVQPTPPTWRPSVPQPSLPPPSSIPKSTYYNRKRRAQQQLEGQASTKVYKPRKGPIVCSQCHQPRDRETHTQYYGSWYCQTSQTQPLAEWKAMMSERRLAKVKADKDEAKKD